MNKEQIKLNKGFTLIEVLIAVGLFVIVMTMGVASVLQVNTAYKKSQQQRAIMDTLSFVMEDMVRNIALGSEIHCQASFGNFQGETYKNVTLETFTDDSLGCNGVYAISFVPFDATDATVRTAYYLVDPSGVGGNSPRRLYKSTDSGTNFSLLNRGN